MALADEVQARISEQVLVEKTNPRSSSATAVDTQKLARAATAVQAWFAVYAQEEYDSSIQEHVECCVFGVLAQLDKWGSALSEASRAAWTEFREECERIKAVRARGGMTPKTSSKLTPSDENPSGAPKRPWADDRMFDGLSPRLPSGEDYTDN